MKAFILVLFLALFSTAYPAAPSLRLLNVAPDREVTLSLNGTDGIDYALEISSNLVQWADLLHLNTTNQTALIRRPAPAGATTLFFRAREATAIQQLSILPSASEVDSVATLINATGSSVELSTLNGTRIVLNIAPDPTVQPRLLTVTLLTNVTGLPFSSGTFGAVRIEPEQLRFSGSLQIYYPDGFDRRRVVSFRTDNDGSNFQLTIDRARGDHVLIPISRSGIYGSSSATLQEANAALAYQPQYDPPPQNANSPGQLSAASRGQACWGDTLDNEDFLPSTKECFEERINQALITRCRLERSLEPIQGEFIRIVLNQRQLQLLGVFDDADNVLQQIDGLVCTWYNANVLPLWEPAKTDCSLTFVLLRIAVKLNRDLQLLGATNSACIPNLQTLANLTCPSVAPCLKEIEDCCKQGKSGAGRLAEIYGLSRQFNLLGTLCFDPFGDETKPARDACLTNTWVGKLLVQYIKDYETNYTEVDGGRVTDKQVLKWYFESPIYKSFETTLPGFGTNINLQILGDATVEEHNKFETWNPRFCPEGGEVEEYNISTENAGGKTNGSFNVLIQTQPAGSYTISMGFTPPSIHTQVRLRDGSIVPSCDPEQAAETHYNYDEQERVYSAPTLLFPYTGTLTTANEIHGSTDLPETADPNGSFYHFEWNFVRGRTSP